MGGTALVLGGGGVTGIAWELGVLLGLREAGLDLTDADIVIGTSAGSVVGAQVRSGMDLADLYARQTSSTPSREKHVELDLEKLAAEFATAAAGVTSAAELRGRVGRLALATATAPEGERVEIIASRLPSHDWPEERLLITAVEAETGDFVVWDRNSGVPLVSAVAASCAVPAVWPPVTIDGRRYVDGGVRSGTCADLAAGAESVVVLAPMANAPAFPGTGLGAELEALGEEARTAVVHPDEAATTAIGPNVLDPSRRAAAAEAGRAQGLALAAVLRDVWV
jgi:NTE family protein